MKLKIVAAFVFMTCVVIAHQNSSALATSNESWSNLTQAEIKKKIGNDTMYDWLTDLSGSNELEKRDENWTFKAYLALGAMTGAGYLVQNAGGKLTVTGDAIQCVHLLYNKIGNNDHGVVDSGQCSCGLHLPGWSNKDESLMNVYHAMWGACSIPFAKSRNYVLNMDMSCGVKGGLVIDCTASHYNGVRAMVYDWTHNGKTCENAQCTTTADIITV